jgi:hypothetical protein
MHNLYSCQLAIGLKARLQVAVNKELMEALCIARVGHIVQLKLN